MTHSRDLTRPRMPAAARGATDGAAREPVSVHATDHAPGHAHRLARGNAARGGSFAPRRAEALPRSCTSARTRAIGPALAIAGLCAFALLGAACGGASDTPAPGGAAGPAPAASADAGAERASNTAAPEPREIELSEAAQREAGLVIDTLRGVDRPHAVQATGQLQPSEDGTWRVGALVDGRVITVLVAVGDRVSRDQVLARVHSHEVHEARAAYRLAQEELERRRMLAAQAERVRDRTRRLFDLKAASREQMETADTEFRTAAIGIENARTELEKARVHITEFLDLSLDDLDHAAAGASTPAGTRASSGAPDDGDLVPIKSPAAGTVMERLATPGTVVSPGAQMFTVASLSTLWMAAAVNEADLSLLKVGQTARVTVKAYPGETFTGRVLKLGDALDPATRTLQVRIALPNPEGRLKPEMFATASIDGAPLTSGAADTSLGTDAAAALFVPQAAIQDVRGASIVFVRTAPTRFAVRSVTLGLSDAGRREVRTGLRPGDAIVVKGAFTLKTELLKSTLESD